MRLSTAAAEIRLPSSPPASAWSCSDLLPLIIRSSMHAHIHRLSVKPPPLRFHVTNFIDPYSSSHDTLLKCRAYTAARTIVTSPATQYHRLCSTFTIRNFDQVAHRFQSALTAGISGPNGSPSNVSASHRSRLTRPAGCRSVAPPVSSSSAVDC